jgi:hypothetical protein
MLSRAASGRVSGLLDAVAGDLIHANKDVGGRAREMVDRLATELGRMSLDGVPRLHSHIGSDGAFLIEWTVGHRRIGINIERAAADSSWYYVSFDPAEIASASGPVTDLDLPVLLRRLVRE